MTDLSKIPTEELMRMRAAAAQPPAVDLSKLSNEDLATLRATAPEAPSAVVRLGRGIADVTEGIQQGAMRLRDLTESGPLKVARYLPGSGPAILAARAIAGDKNEAEFTREKTEDLARYEAGRKAGAQTLSGLVTGQQPDPGIDWLRMGGNVAATLPTMLVPGGGAATMGTRIASGAAQGALAGGATFTPEGQSKAFQVTLGAGLGALAPVVVKGIQQGYQKAVEGLLGGSPGQLNVQTIEAQLQGALQRQGVDWGKLTQDVKNGLIADAQKALNMGGDLPEQALANRATIESVGAQPTRAMVTRAPKDWQTEKNLRGVTGVGEPLAERDQSNAKAMVEYLQRLRQGTGGNAATPYEAGESAIGAIRSQDAARKAVVDDLYDAFRASGAENSTVQPQRIADALGKVADEIGTENIPPAVLSRLKSFGMAGGSQTKLLTVGEADKLNRLLNNNNPGNGPASLAIRRLKTALDDALMEVPDGGIEALKTARAAAAERFAAQRSGAGVTAAIDDVAPDKFVQRFILGGDARDLKALKGELLKSPDGQQAMKDVKGTILDSLLLRASNSTSVDDIAFKAANNNLQFSGQVFGKALDSIPPEKLHMLFTPDEIGALRTLQKAAKLTTSEVPFSDVNYSKTTAALANLLQRIGQTPVIGQMVSPLIGAGKIGADWVKSAAERKAVAEALLGSAAQGGTRALPAPGAVGQVAPGAAAAAFGNPRQRTDQ